ncbi:MAG TPA: amino acid permease [Pyrinomonadaceae bacterium]|jgi:APA family basic amino acid/polyamine antiporter|nr:amino acid permease [Pyrinomonadaceae bacterium]
MTPEKVDSKSLIRGLGLIAAVSVIIGNVIGTGVFLKARVMTCNVGSPGWVIAAWVAAGFLSLSGALTYAELTAMRPVAGAQNVFLKETYGKVASFLFGWMQILVARPGSQAAAAMAFSIGVNDFLDGKLAKSIAEFNLGSMHIEITTLQTVALMVIFIFTTLNCASISLTGRIATALTFVKIALIVFVAGGAFVLVSGDFSHMSMVNSGGACEGVSESVRYGTPSYSFLGGFAAAMLGALWGYDGWDNLTFVAGEVKDPKRNIPLAIVGSMLVIIVLYLLAQLAYFYVLDPTTIASVSKNSSVAKVVVSMFFGGTATSVATGAAVAFFTVGLMLSSLGTLHTSLMSAARVPYRMAREGLFFRTFGRLSINHVPVASVLLTGALAAVLALIGSFDTLTDYVVFAMWIFYALITGSIFIYRRKYPHLERPYKAWGYPVVPVIFLLVAAWLLYRTVIDSPWQSVTGLIIIAAGLPFYFFFVRTGSPEEVINEDVE